MSHAIKDQVARVMKLAKERGMTLATVESCTAGLLAYMLSEGEAASDILHGGFIVYTKENRVFVESCGWIVGLNASVSRIVTGFRAGVGALGTGRDFDGDCGEAEASAVGRVCVPRLPA